MKPHVEHLSERERREVESLTEEQRRGYKNLRESSVPHKEAMAIARQMGSEQE